MSEPVDSRRGLPSIDRLLQVPAARALLEAHPRAMVVDALRQVLAAARQAPNVRLSDSVLIDRARAHLAVEQRGSLRRVINATGVILHTNLGRAPLSAATVTAMREAAERYSSLEYDLDRGERASRHDHLTTLLQRLTGAEAALVVNNNAGGVLLALAGLAADREVVISRGQLVEIGGGFRIPDVLVQGGARLIEVGTTNRTYVEDYERAITDRTALLLRVHSSNFKVSGFVHAATLSELAALAKSRGLLLVDDLGSGSLLATEPYGLVHEPIVQESIAGGADVVCFSGDKLLGGPQAGLLVGRAEPIAQLRRHPLTRALRPDKATVAGLHATLLHYLRGEAEREVPVWRMIATPVDALDRRGHAIVSAVGRPLRVVHSEATVGGGSLPGETLPSRAIRLEPGEGGAERLAASLRAAAIPVVGRVNEGGILLDLRTVAPDEDQILVEVLRCLPD